MKFNLKRETVSIGLIFVLLTTMLFSIMPAVAGSSPTAIYDCDDLQDMNNDLSGNYYLANDIDCSETAIWNGGEGFIPIGVSSSFNGTLDGRGYEITNLYINRPAEDVQALFSSLDPGAIVSNVGLVDATITGESFVGGIAARNINAVISCCYVESSDVTGLWDVGGIVGENFGKIYNCYFTGNVDGDYSVGGVAGRNGGETTLCNSVATVSGKDKVGGLAGYNDGDTSLCWSDGTVSCTGMFAGATGGLVGHSEGARALITNCYAMADVSGNASSAYSYVGGLVGLLGGGGWGTENITNCYSTGYIDDGKEVGGLVGANSGGTVNNSFWDTDTSGQSTSDGGTGLSTADMMKQASYVGWDFAAIWQIIEDITYPYFQDIAVCYSTALTIDKEADREIAHEGDVITYTYTVNNTGNVAFAMGDILVTDPDVDNPPGIIGPTEISGNGDGYLDPGEIWQYSAQYTVPWFEAGPISNVGAVNATSGSWISTANDELSIPIEHTPGIDLYKEGPEAIGYFEEIDPAIYIYTVDNTGDCSLNIALQDSECEPVYQSGDFNGNGYLDPGETWEYMCEYSLVCEGEDMTIFYNEALASGVDVLGDTVSDNACWNVIVFQWQPRTIGYWGNWKRHYTGAEFESIFNEVLNDSANLDSYEWLGDDYKDVRDFLLRKPPFKKKDTDARAIAQFHMEKQYLATWLSINAYLDWTGAHDLTPFPGSADVGMNPDAIVYLTAECMPEDSDEVFESGELTVLDLLQFIENEKGAWSAEEFKVAYEVLDIMNNAEENGYCAFVDPQFDPTMCAED